MRCRSYVASRVNRIILILCGFIEILLLFFIPSRIGERIDFMSRFDGQLVMDDDFRSSFIVGRYTCAPFNTAIRHMILQSK